MLGGFLALAGRYIPAHYHNGAVMLFYAAIICSLSSTWLGNVRALRRPME
jgi:hypothetical protein